MSRQAYSCAVIASAIVAWFVIFPDELMFVERVLLLSQQVATGAWALLIALVIVGGAVRIWGQVPVGRRASP